MGALFLEYPCCPRAVITFPLYSDHIEIRILFGSVITSVPEASTCACTTTRMLELD